MGATKITIGIIDNAVFGVCIAVAVGIGIFHTWKNRRHQRYLKHNDSENYLIGTSHPKHAQLKLPLLPVGLSIVVSFQSSLMMLGVSSEMYVNGMRFLWLEIGNCLAAATAALLFVPVFHYFKYNSVYEYLEIRFQSKVIRLVGACFFITISVFYMSLVVYAPSVALQAVTGVNLYVLIAVCGATCILVAVGGLKSVIWTEAAQSVLLLIGLGFILVKGILVVGGVTKVFELADIGGRLNMMQASASPFVYMALPWSLIGGMSSWIGWYGVNQVSVCRYSRMDTVRQGQYTLLITAAGVFTVEGIVMIVGITMYAFYADQACDPLSTGAIWTRDELFPTFVMEVLGQIPGACGLFLATLYSGTMNAASSGLHAAAAIGWEDFVKHKSKKQTLGRIERVTRIMVIFLGSFAIGLAFLAEHMGGVLQAGMSIFGAINGPMTGIFILGLFVPWASAKGAICGAITAVAVCGSMCVGSQVTRPYTTYLPFNNSGCENATTSWDATLPTVKQESSSIFGLSFILYDLLGILTVLIVGTAVSFATGANDPSQQDIHLFSPYVHRFIHKAHTECLDRSLKKEKSFMEDEVNDMTETFDTETETEMKPIFKM